MANKLINFEFDVILKDSNRDIISKKHKITVRRTNFVTAKDYIIKKYPYPYFVELNK